MQPVPATARADVDQRCLQVVAAQEPIERAQSSCRPLRAIVHAPCRKAGRNCRSCFYRLLVERLGSLAFNTEAFGADWSEVSIWCGLQGHEPAQGRETNLDELRSLECFTGEQ